MRIATWNLQRPRHPGGRREKAICRLLEAIDADVWVLTETHESVTPGCGYEPAMTSGTDRPGQPGERWAAIWSRYPIESLPPTRDPVRSVLARVAPPYGAPLVVCATVLPWLGSPWQGIPSAHGAAFAAALDLQAGDWEATRRSYPDHDLLVAGDFNQDLASSYYYGSRLNRAKLLDVLRQARLTPLTSGNHDPIRRDSPPFACIDHMCLTEGSNWQPGHISRWPDLPNPDRRLSGHFGVAIDFQPA